jgi:superfamily II DNA or RNA helicase
MSNHQESASGSSVLDVVLGQSARVLKTYGIDPGLVQEHSNLERSVTQGGYGDRQILELVQNASDEIRSRPGLKIKVVLTETHLYCANEGNPMTPEGADTILRMGVSRKRGGQIGRFGMGLKSVLEVSDTPEFFSETGCFGFDRDWSATEITNVLRQHGLAEEALPETPVLRMGRPLDRETECANDAVLRDLLEWAVTVVRMRLRDGAAARLGHDIAGYRHSDGRTVDAFPTGFQLFSPHVGQVELEDRRTVPTFRRRLTVDDKDGRRTIREVRTGAKEDVSHWRVFTREYEPSEAVRKTAGELHDRVVIDIAWAVPDYFVERDGIRHVSVGRGQFWAYFPTKYGVSLTGYLNSAWKTNQDRQNLLDGSGLNQELFREACRLVVESLPELAPPEDPAAYLPLLPQREKDLSDWADKTISRLVWEFTAQLPSLPDQDGILCQPIDLNIHPKEVAEWLPLWAQYSGRPSHWVHPSVEADPRRHGKMEFILNAARKETEDVRAWLEALVEDGTADASAHAIKVLAAIVTANPAGATARAARSAEIVLTEKAGFVAPEAGQIYLRSDGDDLRDDLVYIDRRVSDRPDLVTPLHVIGVHVSDARGRFDGVLDRGLADYTDASWVQFWTLLRAAGGTAQTLKIQAKVADVAKTVKVRNLAGAFVPLHDCLLPGPVVPADGSRDRNVTVDPEFHGLDLAVLRELGMKDRPTGAVDPRDEYWFEQYREAVHEEHQAELPAGARRPNIDRLTLNGAKPVGMLHLLLRLSEVGRAAFTKAVDDTNIIESWTKQYSANQQVRVQSPLLWMLHTYGVVETSQGLRPSGEAVGPQLQSYSSVLPVAKISPEKARRLGLPTTPAEVPSARWNSLFEAVIESEDDGFVGRAYALLLRAGFDFPTDALTRCRVGRRWELRSDADIAVAVRRRDYDELVAEGIPAILVEDKADAPTAAQMIEVWGMLKFDDVVTKEFNKAGMGPASKLVDEYPPLKQRLDRQKAESFVVRRCSQLEHQTRTPKGSRVDSVEHGRYQNTLYVLDTLDECQVLEAADREFGWNLGPTGCTRILQMKHDQEQEREMRKRLEAVRSAESVIDKVMFLLDEDKLRSELPEGLLDSEIEEHGAEPDARRVAELAFHAHGESVLRIHARDLAAIYPAAPSTFAGDSRALKFVTELGFPDSFAGTRVPSLDARFEVDGPRDFPALHPYQEQLAAKVFELLTSGTPQKGMLSIPTGAGKTRVTSEAVIRWIRHTVDTDVSLPGPILWIAQTEELCEQAVQSWSYVWSKVGAEMSLVISRLWASNEASAVDGRPHLVVATDAKLRSVLEANDYEWLRLDTSLVIVDEAHVAIAPQYTKILEELGITATRTSRTLIGLTATPFRNNEELTRRLVARFGSRLDTDVFGGDQVTAIKHLQSIKALAQVEHRVLEGGTIQLSPYELTRTSLFGGVLPKGAEQRLADDHDRTRRIVDEIAAMPADWPVLVFATSVAHAKILAAKLGDKGITAAAIDATTATGQRRKTVDDFRERRIQVLTNYGVLTQGFDAPATRAVVVARPAYSANVYQQMIGRGLRGPLNQGKETCLILNVEDNVTNYEDRLAFTDFDYLWNEDAQ